MPKIKTHKGAKKRFKITGTGKVTAHKLGTGHLFTNKTAKRKRNLRKKTVYSAADARRVKSLLPYG